MCSEDGCTRAYFRGASYSDRTRTTTADWVIIGAETGNRKGKVVPKKDWVMKIAEECEYSGIPVFMKESLRDLMGDDFRQEFPWNRN